jgi:ferredoxin
VNDSWENRSMRVSFKPLGTAADTKPNETVLDAARRADAPLGNSCGSVGV